jgi:aspartate-semialdehyde dehydrogenase
VNAEILAVGTEILLGDIVNTNAQYIARRLADMGVFVYHQSVVGDNPERLKEAYSHAFSRVDLVIATGGLGPEAIEELENQVKAIAEGNPVVANILPGASLPKHYQIAFNLIPQIDVFKDYLYTKEEMKMIDETHKIMDDYTMGITATTIRVPVYRSHAESINLELENELSVEEAKKALTDFAGVIVQDNPDEMEYPMPLYTSSKNEVFVGRIRKDYSITHGLNLWVVGD